MNLSELLSKFMQSVSEAAARIFRPSDDSYPESGVQPFEGEPYHGDGEER
ncbi:isochorismate synthase [Oxynema sp. CENA135]|uniref:Isochorismate synthase n=1 Tax=Oxynema aestuarii AP17 TaxID=2064643 RepID=A0A6H1U3D8_9CYAN|nr:MULTISPECIES: isochorismate synthase [Oxynema]MBK4731248.1 isochorismate synthase [Oxynema sp. CENA135]QIZ73341.1 isochorismate synthase [Oxynema aestuarii AP17]RMH71747.1 MAG: isochorismate synthase [Cyanobacteria bacterium J007]